MNDSSSSTRYSEGAAAAPRDRLAATGFAVVLHLAVLWVVIHGFGGVPALSVLAEESRTTQTFDVPLDPPKPAPSPTTPDRAGASGEEGRKATAKATIAKARVPSRKVPAPPVASTGNDTRSGASAQGTGTGGGGEGMGTGSGASGNGSGGGLARKAEKISGDIRATKDYPAKGRDERIGKRVVILLTVGTDGRPTDCKVWRSSGVPEADAITCKLASDRFRFRPAINADGAPIEATYGWEQRWFAP
ncbi:TonB family protein [Novosphingobium sp. MMS21-SN21R]|uniref:TonB family protein n=1 Tax=Novosphingobium sp. MMS21-SN21R TaxID=2969298 RepID=UPI0028879B92|nr:TonB family protein [Novosphingobium sp. MMS21-SN21R]MDT0507070.1 TonB family protein [Novosphingobium sp. MMS21-SN21R]